MKFYVSGYSDDVVSWRAGRKQEELSTADASFVIKVPPNRPPIAKLIHPATLVMDPISVLVYPKSKYKGVVIDAAKLSPSL